MSEPLAIDWDAPIPATWALVALLVLVHVGSGYWIWSTHHADAWLSWLGERPDRARILVGGQFHPRVAGEPWRLVTSTLLHVHGLHLLMNAAALYTLGRLLEPLVGAARFLAAFALGAVGGSLLSQALTVVQSDGASGGAFCQLTALCVLGMHQRARFDDEDAWLLTRMLPGLLGANLLLGFVVPALDAAAHLGGTVVGVALGLSWRPWKPGGPWWVVVSIFLLSAVVGPSAAAMVK